MRLGMINAVTGMHSIQYKIDQLADQIANVNSVGYKRKTPSFTDILNSRLNQPEGFRLPGRQTPHGLPLAHGARPAHHSVVWTQGSVNETGEETDLMIKGDGLFELAADETGARRFTRGGSFQWAPLPNGMKRLVTSDGVAILDIDGDVIDLPGDMQLTIDARGNVFAREGENGEADFITTLRYVHVLNPQQLEQSGENTYRIAEVDGERPDDVVLNIDLNADPRGEIQQGALEMSNVDLGWTMSELLAAQRSYQLNARALASIDTMNGLINSIRS